MNGPAPRRTIRAGFERLAAVRSVPRHQHAEAYATIVLDGAYEQLSYAGRLGIRAGDVVVQPTFDCHADRMLSAGITLVRLPWRREESLGGVYRKVPIGAIARAAERDIAEAAERLAAALKDAQCERGFVEDWADRLACDLAANPRLRLARWARLHRVTREHVSRCFSAAFGVTPARFRSELSARAAWLRITGTRESLSAIAGDLGFADQAHMTRAVVALTGAAPSLWRRSHSFKTERTAFARLRA